jgi:hypothetical protein
MPASPKSLPNNGPQDNVDSIRWERKLGWLIAKFRNISEEEPSLPDKMISIQDSVLPDLEIDKKRILESVIRLYSNPDNLFLNFYGPLISPQNQEFRNRGISP